MPFNNCDRPICVILDFYEKTKRRCVIIRSNRDYLLDSIQPNDELIALLLSNNCITEEQRYFIERQHFTRDKNDHLLHVVEPLDETNFSNFVKCLRQTNQKTIARIIENGGGLKYKFYLWNYGLLSILSISMPLS